MRSTAIAVLHIIHGRGKIIRLLKFCFILDLIDRDVLLMLLLVVEVFLPT